MSAVAMVVLSRGESRARIRIVRSLRARVRSGRCHGVLGLFDSAGSPRAPRFAPLRSLGLKRLGNASVLQSASVLPH